MTLPSADLEPAKAGVLRVLQGASNPLSELVTQRRQALDRPPRRLEGLVIPGLRVAANPMAAEGVVEVLGLVAVGVADRIGDRDPYQPLNGCDHPGFLAGFPHRGVAGLFTWVDDAGDRRPLAGVRAADQQDLLLPVWTGTQHHRGGPDQPERGGTNVPTQLNDEIWDGHGHHRMLGCVTSLPSVSATFDPTAWQEVEGFSFTDITYHRCVRPGPVPGRDLGAVRIAFDRPEVRNAFRPHTVDELYRALDHARMTPEVGVVLLTGNGPSERDGGWAFCSGGDQRIRGRSGYQYAEGETADTVDQARVKAAGGRLHILEVQRLIRTMPKVVIALVNGWAAGGGHSLHVISDLTIASREHARFKQTDADVGSFDAGYGSAYLARMVGQKFAREIFFLGRVYDAEAMHRMGAVNLVVEHADIEEVGLQVAAEIMGKSPTAQRMLKFAFNLVDDGLVGQQVFAGEATRLAYMTDEAVEGRDSFLEKRDPDWSAYPWYF